MLDVVEKLFFCEPHSNSALDEVILENGMLIGLHSKKTLHQLSMNSPRLMVMTFFEWKESVDRTLRTTAKEITSQQFYHQYLDHRIEDLQSNSDIDCISFKKYDYISSDITSIFVKFEGRFFEFNDYAKMSHEQIIEKIKNEFSICFERYKFTS